MRADAFADAVVVLVKNALTPVLERLAAAEARLEVLGDVRDRVVTMETKTMAPSTTGSVTVDLAPVLERLAGADARISHLYVDAARLDQHALMQQRDTAALSERLAVIETRETREQPSPPVDVSPVLAAVAELTKESSALRERIAVAEVRALVPGPAGKDGADGLHGKDGADGLGFGDLAVVPEGERAFTVRAVRGDQAKDLGTLTFPVEIYRGVYVDGKSYEHGDRVTWAGSEWHANELTTTKPGDGSKAWTLTVKRGRDGRDGKDAVTLPIVTVG